VNNGGAALCGFASYRFLKEMVSYIELPFGEWDKIMGILFWMQGVRQFSIELIVFGPSLSEFEHYLESRIHLYH
jgi:hypothetical protein